MSDRRRRFEAQALPHLDAAYNLARWLARPPLDADDIVQDAMLRAFRAFDSVRGDDVKPWLMSIVRNCFLTAVQSSKAKLNVPIPADDEIAADDRALMAEHPDPEAAAIQAERSRRLNSVIATLPQDFREVLVLREKSIWMETYFMTGLYFLAFVLIFIAYYGLHGIFYRL